MKRMMKLLGAAAVLFAAGGLLAGLAPQEAAAAEGFRLFLPTSYEQYLTLEAPADVAVSGDRLAIADGDSLYLYQKGAEEYVRYRHDVRISKLQFTPDGRLFFSDTDTQMFLYDFEEDAVQEPLDINCSTFFIDGNMLYTALVTSNGTTLYAFDHTRPELRFEDRIALGTTDTVKTPCLFAKDGVLYSAVDYDVHIYTPAAGGYTQTGTRLAGAAVVHDLTSVAVYDGEIYYTVSSNEPSEEDGLYRADLGSSAERLLEGNGFNALTVSGDSLFCIKGKAVRELKGQEGVLAYTGYEIAAASDSVNRLSGAGDTVRARGLLVTSDCGNERVSVCDLNTGEFRILSTGVASKVATDGEVIAAAVGSEIKLYREGDEPYYVHTASSAVLGVSVIFGRCYYITERHMFGVAEEGAAEFSRTISPTALTNDVFGNLYVADQQLQVTKYTEEEFLNEAEAGTVVTEGWRLPEGYRSLRADFEGDLYYLHENALYRNEERIRPIDAGGCVYHDGPLPELVSFALGFEDDTIYLQYGEFILAADNVSFPTLSTILSGGAHTEVFAPAQKETLTLADVRPKATAISVDAGALGVESPYFAYTDYSRTTGGRGVVLCERGQFYLVALFEEHEYRVALFRTEDCTPMPAQWTDLAPALRYVSSEVALSYFPCLAQPLTIQRLPRATEVSLLARVESAGYDFAYVRLGETTGYLPLAYLTESSPLSPTPENYYIGYLKASEKGVTFHSALGDLVVKEETEVKVFEKSNGLCRITFERDGVEYYCEVTKSMLRTGNPDTLRISLIIVLSVVAVGIVTAYVVFLPRKRREK